MACPPDSQVCHQQSQPHLQGCYQVVMEKVSYSSVMNSSDSQPCAVQEAVRTVEEKCHGNNECLVMVDNMFPDPCPGQR